MYQLPPPVNQNGRQTNRIQFRIGIQRPHLDKFRVWHALRHLFQCGMQHSTCGYCGFVEVDYQVSLGVEGIDQVDVFVGRECGERSVRGRRVVGCSGGGNADGGRGGGNALELELCQSLIPKLFQKFIVVAIVQITVAIIIVIAVVIRIFDFIITFATGRATFLLSNRGMSRPMQYPQRLQSFFLLP